MKKFLDEHFLLDTETAQQLYHNGAKQLPIIDYHCHLSPRDIAEDRTFDNIAEIWLEDDHYKWRAMRMLGIDEYFITGPASDYEKFKKWAATVPHTLRNPLYHWTHMELRNYFGIEELLNAENAEKVYHETSEQLQDKGFSTRSLLRKKNVEVVCTSDDPTDSLNHHCKINSSNFEVEVLPTFRPDSAYDFKNPASYNNYLQSLEEVSNISIQSFDDLLTALEKRIDFFDNNGCKLSDHGLPKLYYKPTSKTKIDKWFQQLRQGQQLNRNQIRSLRFHVLVELSKMYHQRNWIQQYHLGALRNTNQRLAKKTGSDSGFDSIGDYPQSVGMAQFFNELDKSDQLAKTIIYNVNPRDNAVFATMTGNFSDGSTKGKMQYGPAWWYLDQKDGIEDQLNILSNMGLLSCFIGMVTDSRSFLSYSRHEYFRRVLCNLLGTDVEQGELPDNSDLLENMTSNICYYNAKDYFNLQVKTENL